jgi:hypothetical protein
MYIADTIISCIVIFIYNNIHSDKTVKREREKVRYLIISDALQSKNKHATHIYIAVVTACPGPTH